MTGIAKGSCGRDKFAVGHAVNPDFFWKTKHSFDIVSIFILVRCLFFFPICIDFQRSHRSCNHNFHTVQLQKIGTLSVPI